MSTCETCEYFYETDTPNEQKPLSYDGTCRIRSTQSVVINDYVLYFPPRKKEHTCAEWLSKYPLTTPNDYI